jgi:hypothetical protein
LAKGGEPSTNSFGLGERLALADNRAILVDHADRCLVQGNIQTDIMLSVRPPAAGRRAPAPSPQAEPFVYNRNHPIYSITRSQEAMRRLFLVKRDLAGNLPGLPGVFPDTMAPVVRIARDGERELTMMRWGLPPPPDLGTLPVTNVGNPLACSFDSP